MRTSSKLALLAAAGLILGGASVAFAGDHDADDKAKAKPKEDTLLDRWNNSDSPFSYAGITIYGTADVGYSSLSHGSAESGLAPTSEPFFVGKYNNQPFTGWVSSPLEQSKLGIKGTEKIAEDWNIVFKAETGYNPLNGHLVDGVGSVAHSNGFANNVTQFPNDSSRAGQIFQGAFWGGLSNKTFGTVTYGRQNALLADVVGGADPMSNAYAFSLIGFSGGFGGGGGDTEDYRLDNSLKYANTIGDKAKGPGAFRFGAEYQFGNLEDGGPAWQGTVGYDFKGLSLDAAYARKEGAISAGQFSAAPANIGSSLIKATLSDNTSWAITAKYDGGKDNYKLFAGFENITQGNSSNPENLGIGSGILGTQYTIGAFDSNKNSFTTDRVQQLWWLGASYKFMPNLTGTAAYYHASSNAWQINNAALPSAAACSAPITVNAAGTANVTGPAKNCSGSEYAASFLLDYQWTKRMDVYGGLMYSKAEGGYANGFLDTGADNTAVTVGTRIKF